MNGVIPIPIYPWPVPGEQLELVKQAWLKLHTPYAVQTVQAQPGEPGRILGLGAFPPFLCDLAYVPDPMSQEQVDNRLAWLLIAPADDTNGFLVLNYLKSILGEGVREVDPYA